MCYFHFWDQKFQPIQWFFKLQPKTWCNVLDTDDDDVDWLLGGAKAEPFNWRYRTSLKARPRVHMASRKICWARNRNGPQAWCGSGSLSSGLGKPHRASNWAWRLARGSKICISLYQGWDEILVLVSCYHILEYHPRSSQGLLNFSIISILYSRLSRCHSRILIYLIPEWVG